MSETVERVRLPLLPGAFGFVYFIGHADGDVVKIGRTKGAIAGRLRDLRAMSPRPDSLIVRAAIPAGSANDLNEAERTLHTLFDAERQHGEWFEHSSRIDWAISLVLSSWGAPESDGTPGGIRLIRDAVSDIERCVEDWNLLVKEWHTRWRHLTDEKLPTLRQHVPHSLPCVTSLPVRIGVKLPTWASVESPALATVAEIQRYVARQTREFLELEAQ